MVDGQWTQRTEDGACLYYKLTNEPKGSGELKQPCFQIIQNKLGNLDGQTFINPAQHLFFSDIHI